MYLPQSKWYGWIIRREATRQLVFARHTTRVYAVSRPSPVKALSAMVYVCCLADIDDAMVPIFCAILRTVGVLTTPIVARLDVSELGRLAPDLLVCDVDHTQVDALELLRQIRFVLPECLIAVYTGVMKRTWGVSCHLAGVNCVLSKDADERALAHGVQNVLRSGCYTDPRFAAA
jgi:CheY-like chemotaxis protein